VTIRPRRADDLPACAEVLAEVHRQDGYPTCWPTNPVGWLDLPGAWVAEEAGVMAGHIALVAGFELRQREGQRANWRWCLGCLSDRVLAVGMSAKDWSAEQLNSGRVEDSAWCSRS